MCSVPRTLSIVRDDDATQQTVFQIFQTARYRAQKHQSLSPAFLKRRKHRGTIPPSANPTGIGIAVRPLESITHQILACFSNRYFVPVQWVMTYTKTVRLVKTSEGVLAEVATNSCTASEISEPTGEPTRRQVTSALQIRRQKNISKSASIDHRKKVVQGAAGRAIIWQLRTHEKKKTQNSTTKRLLSATTARPKPEIFLWCSKKKKSIQRHPGTAGSHGKVQESRPSDITSSSWGSAPPPASSPRSGPGPPPPPGDPRGPSTRGPPGSWPS